MSLSLSLELVGSKPDAACGQHGLDMALRAFAFVSSTDCLDLEK
jgi:hypothetical protein